MPYRRDPAIVIKGKYKGEKVTVEGTDLDLWGQDWGVMTGNPAAVLYALRSFEDSIPDDGTVYGAKRPNGESTLFHESELQFL